MGSLLTTARPRALPKVDGGGHQLARLGSERRRKGPWPQSSAQSQFPKAQEVPGAAALNRVITFPTPFPYIASDLLRLPPRQAAVPAKVLSRAGFAVLISGTPYRRVARAGVAQKTRCRATRSRHTTVSADGRGCGGRQGR